MNGMTFRGPPYSLIPHIFVTALFKYILLLLSEGCV